MKQVTGTGHAYVLPTETLPSVAELVETEFLGQTHTNSASLAIWPHTFYVTPMKQIHFLIQW